MESINDNLEDIKQNEYNDCLLLIVCPFTNVLLMFYYLVGFLYIFETKNICPETDVWLYNICSFFLIFFTNWFFICQFNSFENIFGENNGNSKLLYILIYALYLAFFIWGLSELPKLEKCEEVEKNKLVFMITINIVLYGLAFLVLLILFIIFIYKLLYKYNKVSPISDKNLVSIGAIVEI